MVSICILNSSILTNLELTDLLETLYFDKFFDKTY